MRRPLRRRQRGRHRASWWTRLRRHLRSDIPAPPISAADATAARRSGEEDLAEARGRTAEIQDVADELRRHRRENHFSTLIAQAMREPR